GSVEDALLRYERARASRTAMITRISSVWGAVGLWKAAPLRWLRDGVYFATPDRLFERILLSQYAYRADA
ncbi:MAG: hypothetical protein ACXVEE_40800, partial [Polyangiales bacterium]